MLRGGCGWKFNKLRGLPSGILVDSIPNLLPLEFFSSRTRATSREEKNLQGFLEQPREKWTESAFDVDGPHYFTILALHVLPPEQWKATRVEILRRLLVASHARAVAPGGATRSVPALGSCCIQCLPVCSLAVSVMSSWWRCAALTWLLTWLQPALLSV